MYNTSTRRMYGLTTIEALVVVLVLVILLAVFGGFGHSHSREKARQAACMSNQKQIALATAMYAQEHDGYLPGTPGQPVSWRDHGKTSLEIDDKIYHCRTVGTTSKYDYGFNEDLFGVAVKTIQVPEATILTADSDRGLTLRGKSDIASRHTGGAVCSYVDGHVQYVKSPDKQLADATPSGAETSFLLHGATNVMTVDASKTGDAGFVVTVPGSGIPVQSHTVITIACTGDPKDGSVILTGGASGHDDLTVPPGDNTGKFYSVELGTLPAPPAGKRWVIKATSKGLATIVAMK